MKKGFVETLVIFILPQVIAGFILRFLSSNNFSFSSPYEFQLYLFLRNLIINSIYICCFIAVTNKMQKTSKYHYTIFKCFLYLYIISSLFLSSFYNMTPYTIISYITARYENLFLFKPINEPLFYIFNYF